MKTFLCVILLALITFSCQKELSPEAILSSIPTVTTTAASSITNTTATSGGNITDDGGAAITVRGICWSTSPNPGLSGNHTTDGTGSGAFASNLTGLTAMTVYYVRAYATNSVGTAYGNEISFTTTNTSTALPTVTTTALSAITMTTATSGGNVVADGGATVTARGVCWSTSINPVVTGNHSTDGNGTGSFTSSITGLNSNTVYNVRAYATNSLGTAYGNQISFTTDDSIAHVYVTGTSAGRCTYWKDGTPTSFTNSGTFNYAEANSIFVQNNDIYVAGFEKNLTTSILEAKVWKNSVGAAITNGSSNSSAIAVSIVNNDMFVLGTEFNVTTNKTEGKIWKNGVPTTLLSLTNPAEGAFKHAYPQGLFINNNDVYVGGYESFEPNSDFRGLVWKNGTPTRLFGFCFGVGGGCTFDYTTINDVFIDGNDVYAIGSSPNGITGHDDILWKNGIPSLINISPSSIFIYNHDIYIAGRVGNAASLWKNGTVTQLTNGVKQGFATAVYVKGNNVYVAGIERDPATAFSVGKVWKNGAVTNLTDGSGTAEMNDIFVK